MIDQTALSVLLFVLLKLALWIGVVLYTVAVARRIVNSAKELTFAEIGQAVYANMRSIVTLVIFVVIAVVVSGIETGYRPKTVIAPRNEFTERMRIQKEQPLPPVKATSPRPKWEDIEAKNKVENEAARREFDALPNAEESDLLSSTPPSRKRTAAFLLLNRNAH